MCVIAHACMHGIFISPVHYIHQGTYSFCDCIQAMATMLMFQETLTCNLKEEEIKETLTQTST